MLNERISNALGDISDDLLQSAMQSRGRKKSRRSIDIAAVVAAAALVLVLLGLTLLQPKEKNLITGPGVIQVMAHGLDEKGDLTDWTQPLEEGEIFRPEKRQEIDNCQTFSFFFLVAENRYSGRELSMQVHTTAGIFSKNAEDEQAGKELPEVLRLLMGYYGQEYEIEVAENVYWQTDGFDYLYMEEQIEKGNYDFYTAYRRHDFEKSPAYIHVILRADGHIVGFCRIRITLADDAAHKSDRQFCFQVVTSISFPQVDGQWQDVTEEEVRDLLRQRDMERLRQEHD